VIIMQYLSAEGSARIGEEIDTMEMAIGFQRIAMQKTEDMEFLSGLVPRGNVTLPHYEIQGISAHKAGEKPEHQHRPPSRQPALVMREIPLLKIPAVLQRGIKEKGGKVYRIGIVRSHLNLYTIKIRCNTKKAAEHYDQSQPADQLQATEKLQNADQSRNMDHKNTTGSSKCGDGP
jgi:hypothetical protein